MTTTVRSSVTTTKNVSASESVIIKNLQPKRTAGQFEPVRQSQLDISRSSKKSGVSSAAGTKKSKY